MKKVLILFFVFNAACAFAQNLQWAKSIGSSGFEILQSSAIDGSGNVYLTGFFSGTLDFDPGPGTYTLATNGNYDTFITKLDSSGNFVWAGSFGSSGFDDEGTSITTDGLGNIYVCGRFCGPTDFDLGPGTYTLTPTNSVDAFVIKLNSAGNLIWAKDFPGILTRDIVSTNAGVVYITGGFGGMVDFNPGTGTYTLSTTSFSDEDAFILKLDVSGNFIWAKNFGDIGNCRGTSMEVDALDNVFITGDFSNTVDFDPGVATFNITVGTSPVIFISKLDSSGNFVWAHGFLGVGNINPFCNGTIAVDRTSGSVYKTGLFSGSPDFDPGPGIFTFSTAGNYILKLDGSGNFVWAKEFEGSCNAKGITTDNSGQIYITGNFGGTADFDPGIGTYTLSSSAVENIFISKLDSLGNFIWAKGMSGNTYVRALNISVNSSGNVHATGIFESTVDFDPGIGIFGLTSAGSWDMFILKLGSAPTIPTITGMIENNLKENGFNIYPNPNNGSFTIKSEKELKLNLTNSLGQLLQTITLNEANNYQINTELFSSGIYFLSGVGENLSVKQKIVVTK